MNPLTIYVDGGCPVPGGLGAWAVVGLVYKSPDDPSPCVRTRSACHEDMTNQRAELLAVYNALRLVRRAQDVTVVSDSLCAIRWTTGDYKRKNPHVQVYGEWIDAEMARLRKIGASVRFVHVKGHTGNEYNEMCDRLCTEAIKGGKDGSVKVLPEPSGL